MSYLADLKYKHFRWLYQRRKSELCKGLNAKQFSIDECNKMIDALETEISEIEKGETHHGTDKLGYDSASNGV